MLPEQWDRVRELFHEAIDVPANERLDFLSARCSDSVIRDEVQSLLASAGSSNVLDSPLLAGAREAVREAISNGDGQGELSAQHQSQDLEAGSHLGPYRIVSMIAAGGMGQVYNAVDARLNRSVALKILRPELAHDADRMTRFVRESQALAALNHPNIVAVYDVGQGFIVTEFVGGGSLRGCHFPLQKTLDIVAQVAEGLAAAHCAGVIHRDIKPENILLTPDGRVKIVDFGVALHIGAPESSRTCITQPGMIVGTPEYMSPEQVNGGRIDCRSDIFSLGLVLYEMLCGQSCYSHNSPIGVMNAIVYEAAPDLPEEIPLPVRQLVNRCLEKDPSRRFQTGAELARDLRGLMSTVASVSAAEKTESSAIPVSPAHAVPRGPASFRRSAFAAVAVAVIAAGCLLWQWTRPKPLTDSDLLVLADFTNSTDDQVFNETLRAALVTQLQQSPFIKIVDDQAARQELRLMGRSPTERISNEIAREICLRLGCKATIGGSLASLGGAYAVTLTVTNCQTGGVLARQQAEAASKQMVLRAIGTASTALRSNLGESLSSIQKLSLPFDRVTTPSLEAFQAYTLGCAKRNYESDLAALPFFRRAVELDPSFASAWLEMSRAYTVLGETHGVSQSLKRAFALKDRVSDHERLDISAGYYRGVTGELDKAVETLQLEVTTYPRDATGHNMLSFVSLQLGDLDRAVVEARQSIELSLFPRTPYSNLIGAHFFLDQLEQAKQVVREARARKLDSEVFHRWLLLIAHVEGDLATADREFQWAAGRRDEHLALSAKARNEACQGRWHAAKALFRAASDSAMQFKLPAEAAAAAAQAAYGEALVGQCKEARQDANRAFTAEHLPGESFLPLLTLASCGDGVAVARIADEITRAFPVDTLWNGVRLPSIRAAMMLKAKRPRQALELLQRTTRYERFHAEATYLRALAYLGSGKGPEAAAEFRKILDHKSLNWGPRRPLARLGLARATVQSGDMRMAKELYEEFFTLWKDADLDLPVIADARREYAALH